MIQELKPMLMRFGKHEGKYVEALMLQEPLYLASCLNKESDRSKVLLAQRHVQSLIERFDRRPIEVPCANHCGKIATRGTGYAGNLSLRLQCDECCWYRIERGNQKLIEVQTYHDALYQARKYSTVAKHWRHMVRSLGEAKGLAQRVTSEVWVKFFYGGPIVAVC